MREKIVGIKGSYRNFEFPEHKDFILVDNIEQSRSVDSYAYIQSGVCGIAKNMFCNIYEYIYRQSKPILVIEQPVFRKNLNITNTNTFYYRFGLNHYSYDRGYFNNKDSPSDRWNSIQKEQDIDIKPWRNNGEYILILLQNPVDTSLNSLIRCYGKYELWLESIIKKVRQFTNEPIVIRKHPGFINTNRYNNINYLIDKYNNISFSKNITNGNITNGGNELYKDFSGARLVIGYNSNSLVESVCEGIPTVTLSESGFSYPVSYHSISKKLFDHSNICNIDRTQWLYDCAYTQWKMSEINQGIPHKRLLNE